MPATRTITTVGNDYIDGLLQSTIWNVSSLTYSFPTAASNYGVGYGFGEPDTGFEAFTALQQTHVEMVISKVAEYINITFTEETETDSVHGDLRYAETDETSVVGTTAAAYFPSTGSFGGDAWFRGNTNRFDNPDVGDYEYLTFLHETGHTLGLKHAHTGTIVVPSDKDGLEYTVMTYRSYPGAGTGGYTNSHYPQTFMTLDYQCLQYYYGPNTTIRSSGCVVHINPTTCDVTVDGVAWLEPVHAKCFFTLPWANGGDYELDLSDVTTDMDIDLNEGQGSVIDANLLADLGNGQFAAANFYVPYMYNGNTASLPNRVRPGSGTDEILGNERECTLVLSGNFDDYFISAAGGVYTLRDDRGGEGAGPDGTTSIEDFDFVEFADPMTLPVSQLLEVITFVMRWGT